MKKLLNKKFILLALLCVAFVMSFTSCSNQLVLFGKWADSAGNQITFTEENSYTSTLYHEGSLVENNGSYVYYMNIITFTDQYNTVTFAEWDIRGNILYLKYLGEDEVTIALSYVGPLEDTK